LTSIAVDIRPADRAMSLMLADANPRFDLEISASGINSLKFSGPVGLDGLYRKCQPLLSA
jgi:hypothetical protein